MSSDEETPTFTRQVYCGEGVKNDFQKVVDKFLSVESVRYSDFLHIWKEMHFVHIFRGRQTIHKLKQFTEECLRLACELWIESADFQVQVCGLYLLCGLYFCQPIQPKVRIRMTLPMWQAVQEFVAAVKEYNHCDVEYIYMKLILAKAFHFVATVSNENSVQDVDYRRKKILAKEEKEHKEASTMIQTLLEPDNLLKLEVIDQQYQQIKRNLTGGHDTPDLSLSVIQTDLIDAVTHDVTNFKSRRLGHINQPVSELRDTKPRRQVQVQGNVFSRAGGGKRRKSMLARENTRGAEIDEEAMAAAVQTALGGKKSFCGLDTLTNIQMPSLASLDADGDTLMIDESADEPKPGRSADKRGATRKKRSKSTDAKKRNEAVGTVNTSDTGSPKESTVDPESSTPVKKKKAAILKGGVHQIATPSNPGVSRKKRSTQAAETLDPAWDGGTTDPRPKITESNKTANTLASVTPTPKQRGVSERAVDQKSAQCQVVRKRSTSVPSTGSAAVSSDVGAGDAPTHTALTTPNDKPETEKKRSKTPMSGRERALIPTSVTKKGIS